MEKSLYCYDLPESCINIIGESLIFATESLPSVTLHSSQTHWGICKVINARQDQV